MMAVTRRALIDGWLAAGLLSAGVAPAATEPTSAVGLLRVASAFDPQTMDPHGLALLYHARVVYQIYESLISRDERFKLEPALALSWKALSPTLWRLQLRPGVSFHDGSPFSADDAVFSIERALAPTSHRSFQLRGVLVARKIDALTL